MHTLSLIYVLYAVYSNVNPDAIDIFSPVVTSSGVLEFSGSSAAPTVHEFTLDESIRATLICVEPYTPIL